MQSLKLPAWKVGDRLLDREFIRRSGIEVSKKENVSSPPTCGEPP